MSLISSASEFKTQQNLAPVSSMHIHDHIVQFKIENLQCTVQKWPDYGKSFDRNTQGDSNWKVISYLQNLWGLKRKNLICACSLLLYFAQKHSHTQILMSAFTKDGRMPPRLMVALHLLFTKGWKLWLFDLPLPIHMQHVHCWLSWWSSVSQPYRRSSTKSYRTWST